MVHTNLEMLARLGLFDVEDCPEQWLNATASVLSASKRMTRGQNRSEALDPSLERLRESDSFVQSGNARAQDHHEERRKFRQHEQKLRHLRYAAVDRAARGAWWRMAAA